MKMLLSALTSALIAVLAAGCHSTGRNEPPSGPVTAPARETSPGAAAAPGREPPREGVPRDEPPGDVAVETAGIGSAPAVPEVAEGPRSALELAIESVAGGRSTEVAVDVGDLERESDLDGEVSVDGTRFSIIRYSPRVSIDEKIVPSPQGQPGFAALRLVLETGGGGQETWLVPGSRLLGSTGLRSAHIECLPELSPGELVETENLLRRLHDPEPKLLLEVKRDRRRFVVPVREGEETRLTDPDYTVTVLRVFTSFGIEPKNGKAINRDPRPFNPAVEARIEHGGKTRTAWLFSHLPAFSRGAEDEDAFFRFIYPLAEGPHRRAEITVVDATGGPHTVFVGLGGRLYREEVPPAGAPARVGGLTIAVAERLASARIAQTVEPHPRGRPAVLVAWESGMLKGEQWVPVGLLRELWAGESTFLVHLRSAGGRPHGLPGQGPGQPGEHPLPAGHPPLDGTDGTSR